MTSATPALPPFAILRKTGSRRSGAEGDRGSTFHAVPHSTDKALCGTMPGDHSEWASYTGEAVTCPRCLKKMPTEPTVGPTR